MTTLESPSLDSDAAYRRADAYGFGELVAGLPAQAREGWSLGRRSDLAARFHEIDRVIVFGVGGSAAGADVVAALARNSSQVLVEVVRAYTSPPVDERTLAVASSFSGNTAETIEAFNQARAMGAQPLVISSGGRLLEAAQRESLPHISFSWPGPPRTAFGYSMYSLLGLLSQMNIVQIGVHEIEDAQTQLEAGAASWRIAVPESDNLAKQIARRCVNSIPVVLAPGWLAAAGTRWAAQINENAKQPAFALQLPEATHNFIEGHNGRGEQTSPIRPLLLTSAALDPREQRVVQLLTERLEQSPSGVDIVEVGGAPLTALVTACYLGDWVSYYLAILGGQDPMPIHEIERLKDQLREPAD